MTRLTIVLTGVAGLTVVALTIIRLTITGLAVIALTIIRLTITGLAAICLLRCTIIVSLWHTAIILLRHTVIRIAIHAAHALLLANKYTTVRVFERTRQKTYDINKPPEYKQATGKKIKNPFTYSSNIELMTAYNTKEKTYNQGYPPVLIRHRRIHTDIEIIIRLSRIRLTSSWLAIVSLTLIPGSGRRLPIAWLTFIIASTFTRPSLLLLRFCSLPPLFKPITEGLWVSEEGRFVLVQPKRSVTCPADDIFFIRSCIERRAAHRAFHNFKIHILSLTQKHIDVKFNQFIIQ